MNRNVPARAAALLILGAVGCQSSDSSHWDDPLYRRLLAEDAPVDVAPSEEAPAPTSAARVAAALNDRTTLSLDEAVALAIVNHPRLRAAAYDIRAAEARELQARLFPNPEFEIEAEGLTSDGAEWGESAFVLAQEFVTAGKLEKAGRVAEAEQLVSQAAFNAVKYELIAEIKSAFYGVLAAERDLEARQELADLAATLLEMAEAQVRAGAAAEPDRLRFEVNDQRARVNLKTARTQVGTARRALAGAIGAEMPVQLQLVGDLEQLPTLPGADEVAARVLERNSRVDAAEHGVELARRAHELAEAEAWSNFSVGAGPRYSDGEDEVTIAAGFGIELPLFDRNQGGIAEALAGRLKASAEMEGTRLDLLDATADAWGAYESARITAVAYRDSILPKAERTLDLTEQGYREGKFDYLRLLDAQQVYIETRIIAIRALRSLHDAAAIIQGLMQEDEFAAHDGAIIGNGSES